MYRLLFLIPLLLLSACERRAEHVVIVGNSWLGTAPVYSAAATNPEILPDEMKAIMLVSDVSVLRMLSNEAAVGAFVTLDNALGLNTMTGGDYCVAMVTDRSVGADAIIAHSDWQLDRQSVVNVGLEDSTLARYLLSRWLEANNMSSENVRTQVLLPTEHVNAWEQNEVDLIVTYHPFIQRLQRLGGKVIFDSKRDGVTLTSVLILNKSRWPAVAESVMRFKNTSWPKIMSLLAAEKSEFWWSLQGITDLGEQNLRNGLESIHFILADAQEQAIQEVLQVEAPTVSEHLVNSGVYDKVIPLPRCTAPVGG